MKPTVPRYQLARRALFALVILAPLVPAIRAADPPAALRATDGTRLVLTELDEGTHIVVVWASWSPRGRAVGARIRAIDQTWGKRARVFSVNFQEESRPARAFAAKQKIEVPVYLDPDAVFSKRFAVTSLPFLLVLEDGETLFAGKLPEDSDGAIRRALE